MTEPKHETRESDAPRIRNYQDGPVLEDDAEVPNDEHRYGPTPSAPKKKDARRPPPKRRYHDD